MSSPPWKDAAVAAAAKALRESMPVLTSAQSRKLAERMLFEAERAEQEVIDRWTRERERDAKAKEQAAREKAAPKVESGRAAWQILGVDVSASAEQISAAYRKRAKVCHPDHGGSVAMMAELNAAREAMLRVARL